MANIISIKSGKWSDDSVWSAIPTNSDTLTISKDHSITLDENASIAGLNVDGILIFDSSKSIALTSTKNIVVTGKLESILSNPDLRHTITFAGINENSFVGDTDTVVASDIGLWAIGSGVLNFKGATKTSWTYAASEIKAGDLTLKVLSIDGWRVGDEIMITPTTKGSTTYDVRTITSISGDIVTLNSALSAHPKVNNKWTAEVANLTRNIQIEGTVTGKTHILIKSTQPSNFLYTSVRYTGPRKQISGGSEKEYVLGRYAIHFHHSENGSRGSLIQGCVVRDSGSHCYVAHGSHGVTMRSNVTYLTYETPYWYDMGHPTHNLFYDSNLAADIRFISRAIQHEDGTPAFGTAGFILGMGDDNKCHNNVVVGQTGMERTDFGGAFNWEADNEGVWDFKNNLAHHCTDGIRTWQNTSKVHVVENFSSYYCTNGIFHGAYVNAYKYIGGEHYQSQITVHAGSDSSARARFEKIKCSGGSVSKAGIVIEGSPVPGALPVLVRDCSFDGFTQSGVLDIGGEETHNVDVINSGTLVKVTASNETARVQPVTGTAFQVKSSGNTNIADFAPRIWGEGDGLYAEYFNNTNFTELAFSRVDPNLVFQEWSSGVHHLITDSNMSVRWTGKIQPQFSETYKFTLSADSTGSAKLFIDGKQTTSASLIAGKLHDIKIEFINSGSKQSGINFYWTSPSLEKFSKGGEYVPQSQLYSNSTPQPPQNQPPIANAGIDQTITLPTSSVVLAGSGTDSDGSVTAFQWTQIAGNPANIKSPASSTTIVDNLSVGTYIFRLTVADNLLATGSDDVTIFVKSAPVNQPPLVSAGSDKTLSLSVVLQGSTSDPDGFIIGSIWEQVSGPLQSSIVTPMSLTTKVTNLVVGTYVFRLTVTDNQGATSSDLVSVVVNN